MSDEKSSVLTNIKQSTFSKEGLKVLEIKLNEIENKVKEMQKEKNLNEAAVFSLIDQRDQYNEQLSSIILELATKNKEIQDLDKTNYQDESNTNLLTSERDNLIKNADAQNKENSIDDRMIYKQLELVLTEKSDNLYKYNVEQQSDYPNYLQVEKILCKSVLVIMIDDSTMTNYYFQTFTIDKFTVFTDIKRIACQLFEKNMKQYDLRFISSTFDSVPILDLSINIDLFLKNENNCMKARTILISKKKEFNKSEFVSILTKREDEATIRTSKNSVNIDDSVQEFFKRFVGLFTYMMAKLEKVLKIIMTLEDDSKFNDTKKDKDCATTSLRLLFFFCYIMFFIFVTLSLLQFNPSKQYFINKSISEMLKQNTALVYNRRESIFDDVALKLSPFLLDDNGNRSGLLRTVMVPTSIRINFYITNNVACEPFMDKSLVCRGFLWSDTTKNLSIINFPQDSIIVPPRIYVLNDLKYNVNKQVPIQNPNIISNYISDAITNLTLNINDKVYSLIGEITTYYGNTYTLFVNSNELNFNTLYTLLLNLQKTPIFSGGLRCVIFTLTFMHVPTNKFVYVYLIYEINTDGYILPANYENNIFIMNVYFGTEGNILLIYDIFRIIFNFFIILSTIYIFNGKKKKIQEKTELDLTKIIIIFLDPIILANNFVSSINIMSFIIKLKYLTYDYTNIKKAFLGQADINQLQTDFFNTNYWYQILCFFETLLIFSLIVTIINFFLEIESVRSFTLYIKKSCYKIMYFICFILFIIAGFTIISNNLYGVKNLNFQFISSALSMTLLNSIGHIILIDNGFEFWSSLYMFFLFIIFIYFLINSFVGLFLETYRLTGLMKGLLGDREKDFFSIINLNNLNGLTKSLINGVNDVVKK